MEHHANVAVVPYPGAWSDVGSWNAVAELTPADAQGNRIEGQGHAHLSHDTYIHAPHRPVVALGTKNLLIIDTPEVTRGSETFLLSENQSTYIPIGEVHRLRNPGRLELEMIEVQSGSYLGEDDIVRLEDTYGRVTPQPVVTP